MPPATVGPRGSDRLPGLAEEVLELVAAIPRGRVLSYGDVSELVDRGGARQVGQVMAHYGSGVPWWRVVRADGSLPAALAEEARRRYEQEGTPVRGGRVAMNRARWLPEGSVGAP